MKTDNKMNFNFTETFNIKVNDNNIKLSISYNDEIIYFEAEEENIFPKIEFGLFQSLKELLNIDRYFRQFDNLKEVFESLKIMINNKNLSIIKEENEIKLKIKNISTNKDFFIKLKLKEKDIKTEINNLIPYICSLNNKISNLENKMKEMKIDFDNKLKTMEQKHKDEIDRCNEKIMNLEKRIQKEINEKLLFIDSNIIDMHEKDLICKWFENKTPISTKLLLNAKIDNNFYKSFFEYCGNKTNTMIFIKTTDGERFGGFTNIIWPINGTAKDNNSFLFSLSKKEKYKIINPEKAIRTSNNSWISFGCGNDLYLYNNLMSQGGGTSKSNYDISGGVFSLNKGNNTFKLSNCEIYQIEF